MSVTRAVRAVFMCAAVGGVVLTAAMGSANNATVETVEISAPGKGYWDASAGRICPREVGYGRYEQKITIQDI